MGTPRLLRLAPSAAAKQKRLAALLEGRDPAALGLHEVVADAQALGSLALAGFDYTWEQATAHRRGEPAPPPLSGLQRAQGIVAADAPLTVAALLAWHGAVQARRPPAERRAFARGWPGARAGAVRAQPARDPRALDQHAQRPRGADRRKPGPWCWPGSWRSCRSRMRTAAWPG